MSKNPSIGCTVEQCKYHCCSEDYCTLEQIMVGTHEADPKVPECTDCKSFENIEEFLLCFYIILSYVAKYYIIIIEIINYKFSKEKYNENCYSRWR